MWSAMPVPKLLILGGTGEAAALARRLAERFGARLEVISSLAGRVARPRTVPGRMRIGGFGGAHGLIDYLRAEGISAVIDATHPFAARISAHGRIACDALALPRLSLDRPMWPRHPGDRWIEVDGMAEAAARLPQLGRRALLTVGAGEVAEFSDVTGVWLLVRLIADPGPLPLADYRVLLGRGPFAVEDEIRLLTDHAVDILVCKASGGGATEAKITAARALGLPVLMIRRPPPEPGARVAEIEAAADWLDCHVISAARPCGKGV